MPDPVNGVDVFGLAEAEPRMHTYSELKEIIEQTLSLVLSFGPGEIKCLGIEKAAAKNLLKSFDDIIANPKNLYGKTSDEVAEILGEEWTKGQYGKIGVGWKFTKGDKVVIYHEGGRHVGPYYGYSVGITGKVKIAGPGYKSLPGDKASIISGD